MEFVVGNPIHTHDRFVSLKSRLLKYTKQNITAQKNNDVGTCREDYVLVKLVENNGKSGETATLAEWTYTNG